MTAPGRRAIGVARGARARDAAVFRRLNHLDLDQPHVGAAWRRLTHEAGAAGQHGDAAEKLGIAGAGVRRIVAAIARIEEPGRVDRALLPEGRARAEACQQQDRGQGAHRVSPSFDGRRMMQPPTGRKRPRTVFRCPAIPSINPATVCRGSGGSLARHQVEGRPAIRRVRQQPRGLGRLDGGTEGAPRDGRARRQREGACAPYGARQTAAARARDASARSLARLSSRSGRSPPSACMTTTSMAPA